MFNEYYFTDQHDEPVYLSIITLNNSVETSLYIGNKLARRQSLQRGLHVLDKNEVVLRIQIKWFKVLPELTIANQRVELRKLKRKELRSILKSLHINNELNPRELPKQPFHFKKIKVPLILLFIGIIWEVLTQNRGKFWNIPSMLIFMIAYFQIFSPLINKVPLRHMDSETKGKFKFLAGIAGMILTQITISKLIN